MGRLVIPMLIVLVSLLPKPLGAVELVVHRNVAIEELNVNVARLLFTMRLQNWPDGMRVRVFVFDRAKSVHREFAKQALDLYPRQLQRVWDRNLFSGSGAVPSTVESPEEMLTRIKETPGAIGYLPDGYATDAVKVLHVE